MARWPGMPSMWLVPVGREVWRKALADWRTLSVWKLVAVWLPLLLDWLGQGL